MSGAGLTCEREGWGVCVCWQFGHELTAILPPTAPVPMPVLGLKVTGEMNSGQVRVWSPRVTANAFLWERMKAFTVALEDHTLQCSQWWNQNLCQFRHGKKGSNKRSGRLGRLSLCSALPCPTPWPLRKGIESLAFWNWPSRQREPSPLSTQTALLYAVSLRHEMLYSIPVTWTGKDRHHHLILPAAFRNSHPMVQLPNPHYHAKAILHKVFSARKYDWKTNNLNFFPPQLNFPLFYTARDPQRVDL